MSNGIEVEEMKNELNKVAKILFDLVEAVNKVFSFSGSTIYRPSYEEWFRARWELETDFRISKWLINAPQLA